MIYIRKLELCDHEDNVIFKIQNKKAIEGLHEAMLVVKQKDSLTKSDLKRNFWRDLDTEFQEYFRVR